MTQQEYMLAQLSQLMAIDSPTGFTKAAADYVFEEYTRLGFAPIRTQKGGILVQLCGNQGQQNALMMQAHLDTLGGMVCAITETGRLKLSPLGGMNANNAEAETLRIHTRTGKVLSGTCQLENASLHVNPDYNTTARSWDTVEAVIDEPVHTKADTLALGVAVGDVVAFEPRLAVTESGFIKSRFLDDKLCVAILLGYARQLAAQPASRAVYHHITVYEEVGHGGAASVPDGVSEILCVDMGCVGKGLTCTEQQVSICAKDKCGPYNYEMTTALINAAKAADLPFAVDVYPFYGSDVEATLSAGHDIRHALIGPGVYASHGYERSHIEGMMATFRLICAFVG